jgi:hypothetical protein
LAGTLDLLGNFEMTALMGSKHQQKESLRWLHPSGQPAQNKTGRADRLAR